MSTKFPYKLEPCPVCGKQPKVKLSSIGSTGYWATVQCKPFLKSPHLKVVEGKALPYRAFQLAIESWNKKAKRNA